MKVEPHSAAWLGFVFTISSLGSSAHANAIMRTPQTTTTMFRQLQEHATTSETSPHQTLSGTNSSDPVTVTNETDTSPSAAWGLAISACPKTSFELLTCVARKCPNSVGIQPLEGTLFDGTFTLFGREFPTTACSIAAFLYIFFNYFLPTSGDTYCLDLQNKVCDFATASLFCCPECGLEIMAFEPCLEELFFKPNCPDAVCSSSNRAIPFATLGGFLTLAMLLIAT